MSTEHTYRVWIGCLACYNGGQLAGEWFDADDAPRTMAEWNKRAFPRAWHYTHQHEELWVFDHENSPVDGEYSPSTAAQYAEWLGDVQDEEREALGLHIANVGEFEEGTVEKFRAVYHGEHEELADVVAEMHDGDELPEWAESHRWKVYRGIAEDWEHEGWRTERSSTPGKYHVFSE